MEWQNGGMAKLCNDLEINEYIYVYMEKINDGKL